MKPVFMVVVNVLAWTERETGTSTAGLIFLKSDRNNYGLKVGCFLALGPFILVGTEKKVLVFLPI